MVTPLSANPMSAEDLCDISDCEKSGQETYNMLFEAAMPLPDQETSNSPLTLADRLQQQKHRRKRTTPVQYCPRKGLINATVKEDCCSAADAVDFMTLSNTLDSVQAPSDENNLSAATLAHDPTILVSTLSPVEPSNSIIDSPPTQFNDAKQGSTEITSSDSISPLSLSSPADIHESIAKQLRRATAVTDSEHQPCPFCSYVFSSSLFLVRHLKYRHGINLEMQLPHDSPSLSQDGSKEASSASLFGSNPSAEQNTSEQTLHSDLLDIGLTPGTSSTVFTAEVKGGASEVGNSKLLSETSLAKQLLSLSTESDSLSQQDIIVCKQCTRAFTTLDDLEQHQRIQHVEKTYQCQHCDKYFQNPSSLKKHTKLHLDGKIYSCEFCDKTFAAAAYLKTHLRLHTNHKPFICKHCGKAFAASGTLISHERIHFNDKPYGCEFCGKRFRQGSHLNRHKIIHTNMKPHTCIKCNRAFADIANLRRHERIHNQDNPNVCRECGKSFINLSSLKKHERLHTNEKPYVCRHCSKPFASSGNLVSHERTHTNERPYICKECGSAFTQSSHLKAHIGTHSTDTLYVCKHCGRGFTQRSTLCVHERIHLNKKPYICKICDRAFTQSSTLKAHIRTHTKERAHVCNICNKAFSARGNLRSHELIHTNEKPFQCSTCPKAFKQGSTLRAHERTHTKERPYVCRTCGRTFRDGSNLKAHCIRIHGKDTPLQQSNESLTDLLPKTECENQETAPAGQTYNAWTNADNSIVPVGIKITKTSEGLTSVLRFKNEGPTCEEPNCSTTTASDDVESQTNIAHHSDVGMSKCPPSSDGYFTKDMLLSSDFKPTKTHHSDVGMSECPPSSDRHFTKDMLLSGDFKPTQASSNCVLDLPGALESTAACTHLADGNPSDIKQSTFQDNSSWLVPGADTSDKKLFGSRGILSSKEAFNYESDRDIENKSLLDVKKCHSASESLKIDDEHNCLGQSVDSYQLLNSNPLRQEQPPMSQDESDNKHESFFLPDILNDKETLYPGGQSLHLQHDHRLRSVNEERCLDLQNSQCDNNTQYSTIESPSETSLSREEEIQMCKILPLN